MRYLITILVCVSFIFSSNSYGQNQYPDKNRFKIKAGEFIKHFPDKGHGGASQKLFFKDTVFTLDYMNFHSISNDSSLVVIRWFNKNGKSSLCVYDTLGAEVSKFANITNFINRIVLFNNGYIAVYADDGREISFNQYFYVIDNWGNLFYKTKTINGGAIISPIDEGNAIAIFSLDSISDFGYPVRLLVLREDFKNSKLILIQNINADPYLLSSSIISGWPKEFHHISLHLKHEENEIRISYQSMNFKKLHSLNFNYDLKSIRKAKKYSKTIRHNRW